MRRHIDMQKTAEHFQALTRCVEEAPTGSFQYARDLRHLIGDAFDAFNQSLRDAGLKTDRCDVAWELEAFMYEYVLRCNPGIMESAEAFGRHMDGPFRKQVLENLYTDRVHLMLRGVIT